MEPLAHSLARGGNDQTGWPDSYAMKHAAGGEGFVRIALTVPDDRLREAAERVGRVLARREEIGVRT